MGSSTSHSKTYFRSRLSEGLLFEGRGTLYVGFWRSQTAVNRITDHVTAAATLIVETMNAATPSRLRNVDMTALE